MTIYTIPKEMPTGDGNPRAGNAINLVDFSTGERNGKEFLTLRAANALKGHSLYRTDPADRPVTYWVEHWGSLLHLPSIDTVRQFLEQIGGRL